MHSERVHKL